MKRLILFILLALTTCGAYAQTDSVYVWNKWCAKRDTLLLFDDGNNVIQIYCRGLKPGQLKIKSLDKTLRIGTPEIKGDTLSVMAMPYNYKSKSKSKEMRLAIMYKKTGKMIKTVNFTSDSIPPLVARVGKIKGNEASRREILAQTIMNVEFPNSLYSYPYKLKQYTFKIQTAKGRATINATSIFIPKDILQQIKDAPAGTVVEFTNIKATCPECAIRTLDDIKLKID